MFQMQGFWDEEFSPTMFSQVKCAPIIRQVAYNEISSPKVQHSIKKIILTTDSVDDAINKIFLIVSLRGAMLDRLQWEKIKPYEKFMGEIPKNKFTQEFATKFLFGLVICIDGATTSNAYEYLLGPHYGATKYTIHTSMNSDVKNLSIPLVILTHGMHLSHSWGSEMPNEIIGTSYVDKQELATMATMAGNMVIFTKGDTTSVFWYSSGFYISSGSKSVLLHLRDLTNGGDYLHYNSIVVIFGDYAFHIHTDVGGKKQVSSMFSDWHKDPEKHIFYSPEYKFIEGGPFREMNRFKQCAYCHKNVLKELLKTIEIGKDKGCPACYQSELDNLPQRVASNDWRPPLFYHPSKKHGEIYKSTRMVGMELECEWNTTRPSIAKMSSVVPAEVGIGSDGSLRNGIEFRTPPAGGKKLERILSVMTENLPKIGAVMSERCGGHIHLNAQDFGREKRLWAHLFATYFYLEPVIASFLPEHRVRNKRYCGTFRDLGFTQSNVFGLVSEPNSRPAVFENYPTRYAALNLRSVETRGTMEIRSLEGTFDINRILHWANIHASVMRYAKHRFSLEELKKVKKIPYGLSQVTWACDLLEISPKTRAYWQGNFINHPISFACMGSRPNPRSEEVARMLSHTYASAYPVDPVPVDRDGSTTVSTTGGLSAEQIDWLRRQGITTNVSTGGSSGAGGTTASEFMEIIRSTPF